MVVNGSDCRPSDRRRKRLKPLQRTARFSDSANQRRIFVNRCQLTPVRQTSTALKEAVLVRRAVCGKRVLDVMLTELGKRLTDQDLVDAVHRARSCRD